MGACSNFDLFVVVVVVVSQLVESVVVDEIFVDIEVFVDCNSKD
jgi:hypothetical protein